MAEAAKTVRKKFLSEQVIDNRSYKFQKINPEVQFHSQVCLPFLLPNYTITCYELVQ